MRTTLIAAVAALLARPAAAQAHVTLQPDTAPAGGFTRLDVRVPNERDDAGTTKVDVQLPPGFIVRVLRARARLEREGHPLEGRRADRRRRGARERRAGLADHLDRDGKQGVIEPGEFQDFGLSLRIPDGKAGDKLTFKALQTYDDGQVVRWIGPEDADEPAPVVTLEAGSAGGGHGAPARGRPAGAGRDAAPPAATTAAATRCDRRPGRRRARADRGARRARRGAPRGGDGMTRRLTAAIAVARVLALPAGAAAHTGIKSYSPSRARPPRRAAVVKVTFKARVGDANLTVARSGPR